MPPAKMLPALLIVLLLLSPLGPDAAAAQRFEPRKLECAAACKGGYERGDDCGGADPELRCHWRGDGVTYTRDKQKLGRVPGWSGVEKTRV